MGWHYKDPKAFPATFNRMIVEMVAQPDEWFLLGAYRHESIAQSEAERFRWFRWCIRTRPEVCQSLYDMTVGYKFRSSIDLIDNSWLLYARATLNPIEALKLLNPELAPILD